MFMGPAVDSRIKTLDVIIPMLQAQFQDKATEYNSSRE